MRGGLDRHRQSQRADRCRAAAEIAQLLEDHPNIPVLIDEAYVDFGGESAVPLIGDHRNLLVVQTMSKSRALAGLRVGYALGDARLIEALRRVKDSFNSYPLGRLAQAGATASVRDEAYFRESCARVVTGREAMTRELIRLGFAVLPSSANFVFARHPARGGSEFAAALRGHGYWCGTSTSRARRRICASLSGRNTTQNG